MQISYIKISRDLLIVLLSRLLKKEKQVFKRDRYAIEQI